MAFAVKNRVWFFFLKVIAGYRKRRNRGLNNFKKLEKKVEEKEKKKKQPHNINKKRKRKKKSDHKSSKDISGPFSGVVGSVGSLPRRFPLLSFFLFSGLFSV